MAPRPRQAPTGDRPRPVPTGDPPARGWHVDVPLVGPVGWPPTGSAAFLIVVGGLVVVDVVSWPLALAVGLGHVLARDHDHRLLREIGEGLETA